MITIKQAVELVLLSLNERDVRKWLRNAEGRIGAESESTHNMLNPKHNRQSDKYGPQDPYHHGEHFSSQYLIQQLHMLGGIQMHRAEAYLIDSVSIVY